MSVERYDAIVIGAGLSGLAAGIRLAQFDRRVVVLERHALWGGLNSYYKLGGRRFDTGLHALTNYVPAGTPGAPLTKVLRQLRLRHADLELGEQHHSEIRFPGLRLRFTNDFALLEQQVAERFPSQRDGFARLVRDLRAMDGYAPSEGRQRAARGVLRDYLDDRLLVDALLLPICFYGSAREDDVDWYQFVVLFRSLFLEGFARPQGGVKPLLDLLVRRYRSLGGELRLRTGVERVRVEGGRARGVVLADGTELASERVFSSAGWVETMRLCGPDESAARVAAGDFGVLSFVETILVLDRRPADFGYDAAITFYNDAERFTWRRPDALIDPTSGVVCSPDNFDAARPPREGTMRLTVLADCARWRQLGEREYAVAKREQAERALDVAARHVADPRPHEVFRDTFTPLTVQRFTGHVNGAVYGSPHKRLDGQTGIENLFLTGTDQGLLGIVGALMSGVLMANRHALVAC